jgi:hypothetical protein
MIISHKYKYIFFKPAKVAGTSVEVNLAKHCGEGDIIAPIDEYSGERDEKEYVHHARNYGSVFGRAHMRPEDIRKHVPKSVWESYFKFSISRNPWDLLVSRYWWEKTARGQEPLADISKKGLVCANLLNPKAYAFVLREAIILLKSRITKKTRENDFRFFMRHLNPNYHLNTQYYFDSDGKPICDFYMRFESLDGDYRAVCKRLGIPYEELPMTKNKVRKDKRHYSLYYDEELRNIIAEKCKREIEFFNYRFEERK